MKYRLVKTHGLWHVKDGWRYPWAAVEWAYRLAVQFNEAERKLNDVWSSY